MQSVPTPRELLERLVAFPDRMARRAERGVGPERAAERFRSALSTVHVGLIAGGTANNIAARDCFSGEVRFLPGEIADAGADFVRNLICRLAA